MNLIGFIEENQKIEMMFKQICFGFLLIVILASCDKKSRVQKVNDDLYSVALNDSLSISFTIDSTQNELREVYFYRNNKETSFDYYSFLDGKIAYSKNKVLNKSFVIEYEEGFPEYGYEMVDTIIYGKVFEFVTDTNYWGLQIDKRNFYNQYDNGYETLLPSYFSTQRIANDTFKFTLSNDQEILREHSIDVDMFRILYESIDLGETVEVDIPLELLGADSISSHLIQIPEFRNSHNIIVSGLYLNKDTPVIKNRNNQFYSVHLDTIKE